MPEARSFGRRSAGPAAPALGPAWDPPPQVPDRGGADTERLSANARRLRTAGELLGYFGLVVMLLAAVALTIWHHDYGFSKIYIPDVLSGAIDFTSPAPAHDVQHMVQMVGTIAWPLLFVTGLIAAWRRRWLLMGLCAATLAVPWAWIGVLLPFGPVMLVLIGGLAALKLYRPRGLKLAVTIILGLVVGPGVVVTGTNIVDGILNPGGLPTAKYLVVSFADLQKNVNLPVLAVDANGRQIRRVRTLEGLQAKTPIEIGARAFVAAQERTIRGDLAGTVSALQAIAASPFKPNAFERGRLAVAQNFVTLQGGNGVEAQRALQNAVAFDQVLDEGTFWFGLGLGLFGPLADIVATAIGRRSKRIDAAQRALDEQRTLATPAPVERKGFGRVDNGAAIQSIAALDGETVLKAITRRMRLYGGSAALFGVLCVLAFGAGALMWLPPAESNTAFSDIGLSGGSYAWARAAGLPVAFGPPSMDAMVTMWFMPALMVVLATFIFLRRFAVYVAGAAVAFLIFWQVASLFLVDQPLYSAPAASFTTEARDSLGRTIMLEPATRAYVQAQLAYVENRPADIAPLLETVAADRRSLDVLAHEQRFDIMREWAGANGYPIEGNIAGYHMIAPMSVARAASLPAMILGGLAGLLALAAVGLFPIAARRRQRISALVEQVHFRQEEYRSVRP